MFSRIRRLTILGGALLLVNGCISLTAPKRIVINGHAAYSSERDDHQRHDHDRDHDRHDDDDGDYDD